MTAHRGAATTALAAILAASSVGQASADVGPVVRRAPTEIAVAIVDMGADRLTSKDPNVRFVDLTPPPKEGFSRATFEASSRAHGELVADAFVREYRRIDPTAPIVVYTVNPFIQKGSSGPIMFSRSMIQQALPAMRDAKVRVAITTFGTPDAQAGARIVDDFQNSGMILFAAAPNRRDDTGIYPAADPRSIAVADVGGEDPAFLKARDWSRWVSFTAVGQYHSGTIDVEGSSFATPRVAAYGVYHAARNPGATTDDVRTALRLAGEATRTGSVDHVRLATSSTPDRIAAIEAGAGRAIDADRSPAPATGMAMATPRPSAASVAAPATAAPVPTAAIAAVDGSHAIAALRVAMRPLVDVSLPAMPSMATPAIADMADLDAVLRVPGVDRAPAVRVAALDAAPTAVRDAPHAATELAMASTMLDRMRGAGR